MNNWVCDESIFISRSLGSSDGVVQVYKLWSADIPLGENSFSFIGEADGPSTIAPLVKWQKKDYVRLLDFIQVNSLMVNASGHVILKSVPKSRIVGRPDGPTTYWRCLDLLPMQIYGLLEPHDMGIKPNFLIIGGDVDQLITTSENSDDVAEVGEWKVKYMNLDAAFVSLKSELEELKASLALADDSLIVCQGEKKELADKLESANEQLQNIFDATEAERQKVMEELEKLKTENLSLHNQLSNSITKSDLEDLKARLDATDEKLARALEELKSSNEELKIEVNKMEVERKKASEEKDKLTAEISNLQNQLGNSVPRSRMEKEKDSWIVKLAERSINHCFYFHPNDVFVRMENLESGWDVSFTKEAAMRGRIHVAGVDWNVYGDGGDNTYAITVAPYKNVSGWMWNKRNIGWEISYNTGRLVLKKTQTFL